MHQTYKGPVKWIVVDDGETAQPVTFHRDGWLLEVIRPEKKWKPGDNTQARNFREALSLVGSDERVAVWEDDDYYFPGWLEKVDEELKSHDLVGQGWNCYYHVRTGAIRVNDNSTHASLCASAFKGEALELFRRQCVRGPRLIDIPMWKHAPNRKVFPGMYVVGMKGLPGRGGIAGGHAMTTDEPFDLKQWIGDDAQHYAQFR